MFPALGGALLCIAATNVLDVLSVFSFNLPSFTPAIYRLKVGTGAVGTAGVDILETIPIVNKNGQGLNGLSNFAADLSFGPSSKAWPGGGRSTTSFRNFAPPLRVQPEVSRGERP